MRGRYRILVVDDSEDARMITQAALEDGDFDLVDAVGSADAAYRALALADDSDTAPAYDLILLDIVMPEVDGVEVCAAIRGSRRYRDVPILMVSSQSDIEVLNQAFVAGANDYVTKPIKQIELLARVRSSLRFKREIDRRRAREQELRSRSTQANHDAIAFDERSGLPGRGSIEAHLTAAADAERDMGLLLFHVESIAAHRREIGDAETDRLLTRLAGELARLPAPLGSVLGIMGDGLFLVLLPGRSGEALPELATAAHARIASLALPHGASAQADHVQLVSVVAEGGGDELRPLLGAMIERAESAPRIGDRRIIRMERAA